MYNTKYIAVIQAGGKGTRMLTITKDEIPKPMILLNEKPMLQWQIENISQYGITEFVIIIGHLGEKVKNYFGDGSKLNVHISYIEEEQPLGSAGALYYLKDRIPTEHLLYIYGDVMFDLAWDRMITFHEAHAGKVTLLAHPNAHPFDSDLLVINDKNQVVKIDAKTNIREYWYDNCVNAGIYILSKKVLDMITRLERMDLEKDIVAPLILEREVYGYRTPEYVKDVGTPERFYLSCKEQREGIWSLKCLNQKQKCIFLDRDGTINKYRGLIAKEEELELEECAAQAIKRINESGYLAIVVTNQPVVARGMCELTDVQKIHQKLQVLLGKEGAFLDDIVFCPHHPDRGFPEENPIFKVKCKCRKPETGMIDMMINKYNIDISKSYIIGDSTIDIQTGINTGLQTVLVKTGIAGKDNKFDVTPDYVTLDLLEAVEYIIK